MKRRFFQGWMPLKLKDNEKKISIISDAHGSVFHGAEKSGRLSTFRK